MGKKSSAKKRRGAQQPTESSTGQQSKGLGSDVDKGKPSDDNQAEQEKTLPVPIGYDLSRLEFLYNLKDTDPKVSKDVLLITTIPQSVSHGETQSVWVVSPLTKQKVLNAPGYPARIPKHREDLYEVRSTPDMGEGVFAKRDIVRGEIIFAERPLFVFPDRPGSGSEDLLEAAIARLSPEKQADFRALANTYTRDQCGPLLGIMRTNNYDIRNLFDGSDSSANYKYVNKIASRINHSCVSNVKYYFKVNSFSVQYFALRDIKAGDQLFYPYCLTDRSYAQRQADLTPYGFTCKCSGCLNATPETDKLRIIFKRRIAFFKETLINRPIIDEIMVEAALRYEKDVLKEGLDADDEYVVLLMAISAGYSKLRKGEESRKYGALAEKFTKIVREEWKGLPIPQM